MHLLVWQASFATRTPKENATSQSPNRSLLLGEIQAVLRRFHRPKPNNHFSRRRSTSSATACANRQLDAAIHIDFVAYTQRLATRTKKVMTVLVVSLRRLGRCLCQPVGRG